MATTRTVLAQPCIRCGLPGTFPCRGCHVRPPRNSVNRLAKFLPNFLSFQKLTLFSSQQYWYCAKACYLQHLAHGHVGTPTFNSSDGDQSRKLTNLTLSHLLLNLGQCKLLQAVGKTSSTQISSTPEQNEECMRRLLRLPSRTLFDSNRIQKLMSFKLNVTSEDSIPCGLMNGGNTCFANSVLQCLVNTHPLQVFLTSSEHSKCPLAAGHGHLVKVKHNFCPICHLKEATALLLDPRYSAILPRDILLNIDKIGEFRLGDQEDAHQFLLDMLFKMHDAFVYVDQINKKLLEDSNTKKVNKGPNKGPAPKPQAESASSEAPTIDYEDRRLIEESSFIYQLFGGKFLDKTRCVECGNVTMRPDPFLILSLGLSSGASLEEALRNYCKIEVLPKSDESLICEPCDRRVTIQRQTTFWQAPEILTIHLKRFDNSGKKINKSVAFSQTLDFTDVISKDSPAAQASPKTTYSLYAMITHYGPFMGAGHYVAFAKLDGKWYLFDDKSVYGINEAIVMKQNAYILFYKKNPPAAPQRNANGTSLNSSGGINASVTPSSSTVQPNSLRSSANSSTVTTSTNTPLSTSAELAVQTTNLANLAIVRLTPPHHVYLTQDGDIMKDVTLRIHLPQLESLAMKDIGVAISQSGRFEFTSPVYYLLFELVFPLEANKAKAVYYEQDRTLVVFAPIAQDLNDSDMTEMISLTCTVNDDRMSEDDFKFEEESLLPVDPILGIEETLSAEEEKLKKGQEKIEALNMETATYRELHENIRELQRNPQRMMQGQQSQAAPSAAGAKKSGATGPATSKRVKPNEPCPCGSTKKYKTCHGKGV